METKIKIPVTVMWTGGLWRTCGGDGQHQREESQCRCDQGKEIQLKQ